MRQARVHGIAAVLAFCAVSLSWAAETYKQADKEFMATYRKRKYAEAVELGKKALALATKPDDKAHVYYYMGHSELNNKKRDFKAAKEFFSTGLKLERLTSSWRMNLDRGLAYALYRQGVKGHEASIAAYRKIIETPRCDLGSKADAYRMIARMLYYQKKYDETVAAFDKLMAEPKASWSYKVDGAYYAASARYHQKKYAEGQEILRAALGLKGLNPYWQGHLKKELARGDIYLKKYKEAIPVLDEVVALDRAHPYHKSEALLMLGQCYTALGQKTDAEKDYQRVIDLKGAYHRHVKAAKAALAKLKTAK